MLHKNRDRVNISHQTGIKDMLPRA